MLDLENILPRFKTKMIISQAVLHEYARSAFTYEVVLEDGKEAILKFPQYRGNWNREFFCLNALQDKDIPTPEILDYLPPVGDFMGGFILSKLPGKVFTADIPLPDSISFDMGRYLAVIHDTKTDRYYDLENEEREVYNPIEYFIGSAAEKIQASVETASPLILQKAMDYVEKHLVDLESLDGPCITHRDYCSGNLLECDGKITGVLDFERGRCSYAQDDLSIISYSVWDKYPSTREAFVAGYKTIRPYPSDQADKLLLFYQLLMDMTTFIDIYAEQARFRQYLNERVQLFEAFVQEETSS